MEIDISSSDKSSGDGKRMKRPAVYKPLSVLLDIVKSFGIWHGWPIIEPAESDNELPMIFFPDFSSKRLLFGSGKGLNSKIGTDIHYWSLCK